MDEILIELRSLSLEDIRQQLIDRGEEVGPLMPSMRHLFEKKLARRIMKDRGIEPQDDVSSEALTVDTTSNKDTSQKLESTQKSESCEAHSDGYFAISLPKDIPPSNCEQLVFENRKEAMTVLKKFPGSRFKKFIDLNSARAFTSVSAEDIVQSPMRPTVEVSKPEKNTEQRSYREPNRGQRIKLKEAVESGDVESVKSLVWSNPHYLISVGETPVVLHEAFRYNSLHLAAKFNRAEVCHLLLDTVSDTNFHQLLFPEDSDVTRQNRIKHMLDLFLNMPDKGSGDSALHFACKFGHPDVVEILVKYSQCSRNNTNKMGYRPCDVINSRASKPCDDTKSRIMELLEGLVYVPLYRNVGNVPRIGEPTEELDLSNRAIRAFAGPMTMEEGEKFRQSWILYPPNSPHHKQCQIRQTKRSDYDKGMERLGRDLADDFEVSWSEYWEFLADYANFRTPEGLRLLDNYLAKRKRSLLNDQDLNGNHLAEMKKQSSSHGDGCLATVSGFHGRDCVVTEGGCHGDVGLSHGDVYQTGVDTLKSPRSEVNSPGDSILTPSDMTLLSYDFQKLKLNDSLSIQSSPCRTLEFDSDSDTDSDDFVSAPSSPSQPITIATEPRNGNIENHHGNDFFCDSDDDEFEDADDFTVPSEGWSRTSRGQDDVIYIEGSVPTKLDLDVYRAIGNVSVKEELYPDFARWRRSVTSFSAIEQNQWPSPARVRRLVKPLPQSPLATPPAVNTHPSGGDHMWAGNVKSKLIFE